MPPNKCGRSLLGRVAWSDIGFDLVIANAITQDFYGRDDKKYVSYDALDAAFLRVAIFAKASDCTIHIPFLIGAGLGGGNANIIQRIIEEKHTRFRSGISPLEISPSSSMEEPSTDNRETVDRNHPRVPNMQRLV